jgi:hypothetical protein
MSSIVALLLIAGAISYTWKNALEGSKELESWIKKKTI